MPMGERTEFTFDEAGRRETSRAIHTGGDIVTTYTYDGSDNVKQIDEPSGNVAHLVYDGADRLTSAADSLGAVVTLTYDYNGNVLTRRPGADPNLAWTFEYDAADRLTKAYDPLHESGSDLFSEFAYDKNGNRTFVTDNLGLVTRFEYDNLQRLIKMTENYRSSGGDATANTLTQYGYNSLRQSALIDPNGNATTYTYDAGLRLTRIRYPDHDPNFIDKVDYTYDKAGNLKTRTDQTGRITTYTYDDLHHLTGRSYSTGGSEAFAFDRSGRLTAADNAAVTLDFEYDDLGRVKNAWQVYVSDPATYQTGYAYYVNPADPNNPRRVVTYPGGRVVTERFDKRLRLASASGGSGISASFGYDLADRRTSAALGNGVASTFGHDLNSRLTSIQHAKDATDLFKVEYGYDAVGNRTFTRQLTSGLTNRSELYGYDQRHRLVSFDRGTITSGSNPTLSAALADADILAAQDWAGSGWDGLDRRGNWTRTDRTVGTTPVTTPETRVADAVNQYTSIDLDGSGSGSAVTPEHDRRGNLTKDPSARNVGDSGSPTGQKFEYDEETRLVTVKRASDNATLLTIKYDALGRLAESTDSVCAGLPCGTGYQPVITRHVFDGIQTTQEYTKCPSQSWALAREFVWGDRFPQPVALVAYGDSGGYGGSGLPSGTSVYHYLHDVLGSVVALTRSDGKVVERYTYDPYGRTVIEQTDPNSGLPVTRSDASVFGNPFAWTGQRYDGGVRLYHFLYRTYLPHLGRWGQRDPLRYSDGSSLFEYVGGRPLTAVDPRGLCAQPIEDVRVVRVCVPVGGGEICITYEITEWRMGSRMVPLGKDPNDDKLFVDMLEKLLKDLAKLIAKALAERLSAMVNAFSITGNGAEEWILFVTTIKTTITINGIPVAAPPPVPVGERYDKPQTGLGLGTAEENKKQLMDSIKRLLEKLTRKR